MNKKAHKTVLWLVAVLAIVGVGALVVMRTSLYLRIAILVCLLNILVCLLDLLVVSLLLRISRRSG
jgi:hypothetical protein